MALTFEGPEPTADRRLSDGFLQIAAVASIAAGVVHAAAIAAHSEHRQAVYTFVGVAAVQLAWGAAALARPRRWTAMLGVVVGAAALTGWALAKSRGISFIDGLDEKEPVRFADALGAVLAGVTILGAGLAIVARRLGLPRLIVGAAAIAIVGFAVPGTSGAVSHEHAADAAHGHDGDGTLAAAASHHDDAAAPHPHDDEAAAHETAASVPPRPFDPALPIDLGGVDGVTPEQQARAENLLAVTLLRLPQWADPAYAEANGFFSIGDGVTGTEHFLNREFMEDGTILDPDRPESLVFDVDQSTGQRTLSAAMYMMPPATALDDVPDIGGALTQWHIHDNLCFNETGQVRGLTDAEGNCGPGLVKGTETPMIHVWIRSHECGPFAALEGVGGGTVPEGETQLCDHAHGG